MTVKYLPKRNILIIQGSESAALSLEDLKEVFQEYNWYTISVDLGRITEDLDRINDFIRTYDIRFLVAYGTEAIFAFAITNSLAKIVFNPCLYPHAESHTGAGISDKNLKSVEEITYANVDAEMRFVTYGIFFEKDQIQKSHHDFTAIYGCSHQTIIEVSTAQVTSEDLVRGLREGFTYFQSLSSKLEIIDSFN